MAKVRIQLRTIFPKDEFDSAIVEKAIIDAMRARSRPELREFFKGTVEGWRNKPTFRGTIRHVRQKFIRLTVQPIGKNKEQYALVSKGARPHVIFPRSTKPLVYRPGYRAATSPGSIKSRPPKRFGAPQARFVVRHPGFEGREFSEQIGKLYAKIFFKDMKEAISKGSEDMQRRVAKSVTTSG